MGIALEEQGLLELEADLKRSGIIFKPSGESFEEFCERIAAEYYLSMQTAQKALQHFVR